VIAVEFNSIKKKYRNNEVLRDITFKINQNEFTILFGEPGCGKSVILRLLTGIEKPDSGYIKIRGENISNKPVSEINIGYIPQSFALYPHYSVYDNIAYPLKLVKASKEEIDKSLSKIAKMLRIDHLLNKKPDQLSGGEKQRVAIARGLVKKTDIFVFDDPLAGLDFKLREQLIDDLREMQRLISSTFIYATSDPLETLMLAQNVLVIHEGRIVDQGPLEEVYKNANHIKSFEILDFPRSNIINGRLEKLNDRVYCTTEIFKIPVDIFNIEDINESNEVFIGIRPGDISPAEKEEGNMVSFSAKVILSEDLGAELLLHLESNGIKLMSILRHEDENLIKSNIQNFVIKNDEIKIYSRQFGMLIGQGGI